jgi:hypothetical protein
MADAASARMTIQAFMITEIQGKSEGKCERN